jgi:hypothetical protein
LIAIASWAADDANVQLKIDWNKLGIDPAKATITAPSIKNFQPAATFSANDNIKVEKGKGWLLISEREIKLSNQTVPLCLCVQKKFHTEAQRHS